MTKSVTLYVKNLIKKAVNQEKVPFVVLRKTFSQFYSLTLWTQEPLSLHRISAYFSSHKEKMLEIFSLFHRNASCLCSTPLRSLSTPANTHGQVWCLPQGCCLRSGT